jgi:hypothetical protein
VLKFDDNDVDCERNDEIVVFVRVGDVSDKNDCGDSVEFDVEEVEGIGVGEGGSGQFISKQKISTTLEYSLEFCPPPKNILFVDDVDARPIRG